MRGPVLLPWENAHEFFSVYNLLFNPPENNIIKTYTLISEKISTWAMRGDLPLAIDSTHNIIITILFDLNSQPNPFQLSLSLETLLNESVYNENEDTNYQISVTRLAYATTIIRYCIVNLFICRFVNGIVDIQQQKMYAQSINKLAELQDLPRIFVDARHDATHDKIPPVDYLRQLAILALSWLRKMYWDGMMILYSSIFSNEIIRPINNYSLDPIMDEDANNNSPADSNINILASNVSNYIPETIKAPLKQPIPTIYSALTKYMELYRQILPISDPVKAYLNTDALPRQITRSISEFYSEYESAGSSLPTQRIILIQIVNFFLDSTVAKYDCILWSHFLSPMITNSPLSIDFFLSSLIRIPIAHFLLERLFLIWINSYSLTSPIQIVNRVCELLFYYLPIYPSCSISFFKLLLNRFSNILHPDLLSLINNSIREQDGSSLLNSNLDEASKASHKPSAMQTNYTANEPLLSENICFVEHWRVCPLGSVYPNMA